MAITVLLCDDDDRFRAVLGRALERKGVRVLLAANAAQTLELCAHDAPDAVVLDLHMPNTNGFRLLSALRTLGGSWRVLLLTGSLDGAVRTAALRLGVHACCAKPADADEIFGLLFPSEADGALLRLPAPAQSATATASR